MATAALLPRHVFGLRGDVKDNIHYLDDTTILYPAGHNIVTYSLETRQQQFIQASADSEGIVALAVTPSKRFLAVAERAQKGSVTIYDLQTLKRRKVLTSTDSSAKEVSSVAFSPDNKYLAAQGGAPEWNLVLWSWEKSKALANVRTSNLAAATVRQVLFGPGTDGGLTLSAVGAGLFRTYRYQDQALKLQTGSLGRKEAQNFTAHAWVVEGDRERIIVGTDKGDILVVENGDVRGNLTLDPAGPCAIAAIVATPKGFAVGAAGGAVTLFERERESDAFRRTRRARCEGGGAQAVGSLAVSPGEEALAASVDANQLFSLSLVSQDQAEEAALAQVAQPFHTGEATGLDGCARRPVLATCSLDRTVRIWNTQDRSCELLRQFTEEILAVGMHPSGYLLAVGFQDKLRLFAVLMDTLKLVREFPVKACMECRFSNGGHQLAIASGNLIMVYATYTCELLGNLRGHSGRVRGLEWSYNDQLLVSCGGDGAVYQWKLKHFKRAKESVLKGCVYHSAVASLDGAHLYAAGSDQKVKEMEEVPGTGTVVTRESDAGCVVTALALQPGGKTLYAGTETGCIRAYRLPLAALGNDDYQQYRCFSGAVTRLRLSADDACLYAASADGSIFVFDIRDRDPVRAITKRDQGEKLAWAEEVLMSKADLDERRQRITDLEAQVQEVSMQNQYSLRLKDMALADKVRKLSEKFGSEADAERARYAGLAADKDEQRAAYEAQMAAAAERQQAQLAALDDQFQAKVLAEVERQGVLEAEKAELDARWDAQTRALVGGHDAAMQELTQDFTLRQQEDADTMEQLIGEREEADREAAEIRRQMEEDADEEIEELKNGYEMKLSGEREAGLRLKGENGIMARRFGALTLAVEEQRQAAADLDAQRAELQAVISGLEGEALGLKRQLGERDEALAERDRAIQDLRRKGAEAEKVRFVLEHRLADLRAQLEPRDADIARLREQLEGAGKELEGAQREAAGQGLALAELRLKYRASRKTMASQQTAAAAMSYRQRGYLHDLEQIMVHIQEPKLLKEDVKQLHQAHVGAAGGAQDDDDDSANESTRAIRHMERIIVGLKGKLEVDSRAHRGDTYVLMQENTQLIKEVNDLREQLERLQQKEAGIATRH